MAIPKKEKIIIWVLIVLAAINLFVVFWHYTMDLQARFPNMDFSRQHWGVASWYSEKDKFINKRTANNEKFDDDAMTCASWYYPFHEKLLVVNALNLKWVVCRVNDRGPAKRLKREIDLTHAAFRKISHSKKGLILVTVIPIEKQKVKNPAPANT